jgi:transcriptional regulator with GAF, ATPase, and Fis domain
VLSEHQSRWPEALAAGREAMSLFGIELPHDGIATDAALERELEAIDTLRAGRAIASLGEVPPTFDPDARMLDRLLTLLWPSAYVSGHLPLARLVSAVLVRLSLERGSTADSAYGYVTHAITVGPVLGHYEEAYEWGRLALAVNARFDDPRQRAKIHQQFQAHVSLWRRPYAECLPHAREALRSGLEAGDFVYAGYGAASEAWPAFAVSRSLDAFVRDYTPTLALLDRLKMGDFRAAHRLLLNWARALQGHTASRFDLSGEQLDEAAYEATYAERSPFFLTFLYAARLHLALVHEEWAGAVKAWRQAREVAAAGTIWPALVDGWGGVALAEHILATADRSDLGAVDAIVSSLGALATHCPDNFRGPWLLVSAGRARVDGDHASAARLAEEGLELARTSSNVQLEALAGEAAARACTACGEAGAAARHLATATRAYAAWGATAKVRELTARHAELGTTLPGTEPPGRGSRRDAADRETSLDMATTLKLARAVAVELKTDDLLRTLLAIAIENAGARRGVFVVMRGDLPVVEAEASADPALVTVGLDEPLESSLRVPVGVVQYVRRTLQDLVIEQAAADERFARDSYVARRGTGSVLCVPVSHQGRLRGVLYLEHDLSGAFTPGRAETMRVVAAQAAISLENARLYEAMGAEIARRTEAERALREALAELEALKNRLEAENVYLQEEIQTQHNFTEIVGNSPRLREALRKVERVAGTESTVLITGETGTGKEIVARAIHARSTRRDRPLVKVNCGAIPAGLVESELFGHVRGAFTGALQTRRGRFELADGGSIFLDEVGELPLDTQVKLLRVLQEQEFEPVGASRTVRVDVRVIAATNRDLEAMVKAGSFRADLFYRLDVFPIAVPPLRERRDDIPLLVSYFLASLAKRLGKPLEGFTGSSLERMRAYDWPGNVRELQNVVERAAILASGPVVDVQPELVPATAAAPDPRPASAQTLEQLERDHILRVLAQTAWTIEGQKGAATVLGLHPNTLRSRMKKLGIARGAHGIS